jgi:3-oxoacyl-[acyl-carrier protein] reductase
MSRHILVTGVSRGLGLAVARHALQAGWRVSGVSRTNSTEFAALQSEHRERARFFSFDLGSAEAVKAGLFEKFLPFEMPLHGYVNNAGVAYDDLVTNIDLARLRAMFEVNVFAPMNVVKYAIRHMLFNRVPGAIVHVSSVSAHTGYKGLAMYAATKGALEAFSKNTAREWGERGIRSNCVVAGFMETAMSAALTEEQRAKIFGRTALRGAASVDSVAAAVVFLLGESAGSITGQELFVDAGTI